MLTKKALNQKIDNLYATYSNISNFDELYQKIMESYNTSKALLNEQILQYDKKIIDNNAASRYSQKSETNMEIIFQDRIRRKAKIHTREEKDKDKPTSSQAEILFFGKIQKEHIINIYDYTLKENRSENKNVITMNELCNLLNSTPKIIGELLEKNKYLTRTYENNKPVSVPTELGLEIGITQQKRTS